MPKYISVMVKVKSNVQETETHFEPVAAEKMTKRAVFFQRPVMYKTFCGKWIYVGSEEDFLFIRHLHEDENEPGLYWESSLLNL